MTSFVDADVIWLIMYYIVGFSFFRYLLQAESHNNNGVFFLPFNKSYDVG